MELNDLTYKIRSAIFSVHNELGPGLLETIYESALAFELINLGLEVKSQVTLPVIYKNFDLGIGYKMDILVNNMVIIEVKSVKELHDVHRKQVLTYLKLSGHKLGLLINFNVSSLKDKESIIRIIN